MIEGEGFESSSELSHAGLRSGVVCRPALLVARPLYADQTSRIRALARPADFGLRAGHEG
jgi:hypothetical protein